MGLVPCCVHIFKSLQYLTPLRGVCFTERMFQFVCHVIKIYVLYFVLTN